MRQMQAAGAFVTTTESIMLTLLGRADHPSFKDVSKVLKEHNLRVSEEGGTIGRLDFLEDPEDA